MCTLYIYLFIYDVFIYSFIYRPCWLVFLISARDPLDHAPWKVNSRALDSFEASKRLYPVSILVVFSGGAGPFYEVAVLLWGPRKGP